MRVEEFGEPARLPDHQRRLHRMQMDAERRRRQRDQTASSDDEARWPGLVEVEQFPNDTKEQ